jgi:2-polyprenyl-6-hydroxyphenyl methylase/3-demethylubiquinone-9 3-methyltransferase
MRKTANATEIENFTRLASEWWDEQGPMKPLHALGPVRLPIIKRWIGDPKGKKVLDVGCGGGIICEPLARMGARVTGIDAGAENIDAAKAHAKQSGLNIDYFATTAEDFKGQFDAVLALEIIEHVDNPALFVESLVKLTKPGGVIVISTLNRNLKSLALAKIAAEYILRWVPAGTHDWKKFKKPSEVAAWLNDSGATVTDMTGLMFDPLRGSFVENARDVDVNYFMRATKS